MADRSRVLLADASDRAKGVKGLLEEFDLHTEGTVALKANYNSDDPFPASTHLETLRVLAEFLRQNSRNLIMAERSGMGNTWSVLKNRGVLDLSRRVGFDLLELDSLGPEGWYDVQAEGLHWKQGFKIAKVFREADKVVQTCCLKTHRFGGHFTMSLKNSVGLVAARPKGISYDYMRELHTSPFQRFMIAEINKFYQTNLILMDAAQGFSEGGPEQGKLIKPGLLLASTDRVAIDAVGVALLRLYGTTPEVMKGHIFEQDQIAHASRLGVGVDSPERIELVAEGEHSLKAADAIRKILDARS
ncbi:MAG: DUF362 domain-containing protein [Methanotrichaceae archaeon]|nr:DUF362 domain-containing protein [Methanotrichaceae archaeon]